MKLWDALTHPCHNFNHIVTSFDIYQDMYLVILAHTEAGGMKVCGMKCLSMRCHRMRATQMMHTTYFLMRPYHLWWPLLWCQSQIWMSIFFLHNKHNHVPYSFFQRGIWLFNGWRTHLNSRRHSPPYVGVGVGRTPLQCITIWSRILRRRRRATPHFFSTSCYLIRMT